MVHRSMSRRRFAAGASLAALTLGGSLSRALAAWPGSLRILCSGPAGSIPDIVARRYAQALTGRLATTVIVDNRVGAAGQLAVAALRNASADGSTLLLAQAAVATVYPSLYARLAYDPALDLKPVSAAAEATLGFAIGSAVPADVTTLRGFIEWSRRHPERANVASPGIGTLPHLFSAALAHEAQVDWQHVAYPGGPAAMVDLIGGRTAALVLPEGLLRQHHVAGKLRVLATSGAMRSSYLPDVASIAEQGFPGLVMREWFAFFMPGAAPAASAEAAASAITQCAADGAVQTALAEAGMAAVASTPAATVARIAAEQVFWQGVLRATGIRAES